MNIFDRFCLMYLPEDVLVEILYAILTIPFVTLIFFLLIFKVLIEYDYAGIRF